MRRLANAELTNGDRVTIDGPALMTFKRSLTTTVRDRRAKAFAEAGIEAIAGTARLVGPKILVVEGRRLEARHTLSATGARIAEPPISGVELLTTSGDLSSCDEDAQASKYGTKNNGKLAPTCMPRVLRHSLDTCLMLTI